MKIKTLFTLFAVFCFPSLGLGIVVGTTEPVNEFVFDDGTSCGSLSFEIGAYRAKTLFRVSATGAWTPSLAQKWTSDRTLVTVDLKDDPKLNVVADDVVNSLNAWKTKSRHSRILKIEKKSPTQVVIEYQNALDAGFPVELCLVGILPNQKTKTQNTTLSFTHVPTLNGALEKLANDDIQFWLKDPVPRFLTKGLLVHARGVSLYKTQSPYTTILRIGRLSFANDVEARKAIAHSINRSEVIKFSLTGLVLPTDDLFFNQHPLYIANSKIKFDNTIAKKRFKPKSEKLIVATEASDKWIAAAKGIAVQLKRVGIETTVKVFNKTTELVGFTETCEKCVALIQVPHTATNTLQLLGLNPTTISSKTLLQNLESLDSDFHVFPLWNDLNVWLVNSNGENNKKTFDDELSGNH